MKKKANKKNIKPGSKWRLSAYSNGGRERFNLENVGVFDELVVDDWMHLEQMQERAWWMRVGPLDLWIDIDSDGKAKVFIRSVDWEGSLTIDRRELALMKKCVRK